MVPHRDRLPEHVRLLLDSLVDARGCGSLSATQWDTLIRSARSARLLGVLAARVRWQSGTDDLPEPIRRHLVAASIESRFRRSRAEYLMDALEGLLADLDSPLVLLKGGAYIAQGLRMSDGRLPADVDLMVRRSALDAAERRLLETGWEFEKTDPYDQHYYRAWSHELPPLRRVGQAMELDLHHTILPPLSRAKPDAGALFAAAIPVAGRRFSVLCPADQVLHAAAHLFQDSDCVGRLRELVDIDGLLREFSGADSNGFWPILMERARLHQLGRPLCYALAFLKAWLDTPIPEDVTEAATAFGPSAVPGIALCSLAARVLPPIDPDGEPDLGYRLAKAALEARAVSLRLPPRLFVYHAGMKFKRSLSRKAEAQQAS
jgi:hypothetical protein